MAQSISAASQRVSGSSMNGHQQSLPKCSPSSQSVSSKTDTCRMLQKLCYIMNNKVNDEHLKSMYSFSVEFINGQIRAKRKEVPREEKYYVDKIRHYLTGNASAEDIEEFDNKIRQNREADVLKNPQSILQLLYNLSNIAGSVQPARSAVTLEIGESLTTILPSPKPFPKSSTVTSAASLPSVVNVPPSVFNANTVLDNRPLSEQRSRADTQGIVPRNRKIEISEATVTEAQLVQDLLYVFQGVNGQFIKYNHIIEGYHIDAMLQMPRRLRHAALRLTELGWMHGQVRQQCNVWTASKGGGAVVQSLAAALREQLTEYYRLVANLQVQVSSEGGGLRLRGLSVWTADARHRFLWLATAAQSARELRGGALVSCVHALLQHGDPAARDIVRHLLAAVCKPMFRMLSRWMLDGELDDPHGEFFVAGNNTIQGDKLWHEKYSIQETMVPSFISMTQAEKVLATGKSINFLREMCNDSSEMRCRDALSQGLEAGSVEALILSDRVVELTALMDVAYVETSRRVIDVLNDKFEFAQHLQALRDFLLLGQGDFIRYLMELLEPELGKPASEVFSHNLSTILDTAVRATNAQYAAADVLRRLDVRILGTSPGDTGWDVFTLDYHTRGPIGTVFAPTATSYLLLFQSLWKAKRIEFILSHMWKQQFTSTKMLRNIPELHVVLQQTHLLTHEMVQTVHQLQYYVMFEVIECCSVELARNIADAGSLDEIVRIHREFVDSIEHGALIDNSCTELNIEMRAMFETILQLKAQVDLLHARAHEELDMRAQCQEEIKESESRGVFGIDAARAETYNRATRNFLDQFLPNARIQLKTLTLRYQVRVRKLIQMLSSSSNINLQLLSFRLDFNDYYRQSEGGK